MTTNPRAIAVLGVGYVAIALATLGLIVPAEPANTAGVPATVSVRVVTDTSAASARREASSVEWTRCGAEALSAAQQANTQTEIGEHVAMAKAISADVEYARYCTTKTETVATVTVSVTVTKLAADVVIRKSVEVKS